MRVRDKLKGGLPDETEIGQGGITGWCLDVNGKQAGGRAVSGAAPTSRPRPRHLPNVQLRATSADISTSLSTKSVALLFYAMEDYHLEMPYTVFRMDFNYLGRGINFQNKV